MERAEKIEKFGPGPWVDEPDRKEWVSHGHPCIVKRNPETGHMCGYVAVPPGHPLHGATLGDERFSEVPSHAGVTYAEACDGDVCHVPPPGEPDDVWWLGWDARHACDVQPALTKHMPDFYKLMGRVRSDQSEYRTFDYSVEVCEEMAEYLAGLQ